MDGQLEGMQGEKDNTVGFVLGSRVCVPLPKERPIWRV
jgi:hypothetical protein